MTATLGVRFVESADAAWALIVFCLGLVALVAWVALAVFALLPSEYLTLGSGYLRRFSTWAEVVKEPEHVRGTTMRGLVEAISRERLLNDRKAETVRGGFVALLLGLMLITAEPAILAATSVL